MKKRIVVGSRRSRLALAQTRQVLQRWRRRAEEAGVALEFDVREIVTKGDKIVDVSLSKVGGKGLFVKEIEQALLAGEIDVAVHSMKDVPAELPAGLVIGAVPEREDPRDALVSRGGLKLAELPAGSVVGTSSLRRACQLRALRPDLRVEWIRGNIDTRLGRLERGDFDAVLLAAAGLNRLGWADRISERLSADDFVPAAGQGALALECREDDEPLRQLLTFIHDPVAARETAAERAFLARIGGGCQVPVGACARTVREAAGADASGTDAGRTVAGGTEAGDGAASGTDAGGQGDAAGGRLPAIRLTGLVGDPDGGLIIRDELSGTDPEETGRRLAERLLERGGEEILRRTGM